MNLFRTALLCILCIRIFASEKSAFDFPIYKNKPPGKQVGGARTAEKNPPLSPEESQRQFTLPKGFEARLFAAEPMVVNPVAMTWDDRGRLWVLELYEYPKGASEGKKGRDRIKILEDVNADGVADKVSVWADGLNLATGLLLGNGGAYVGEAPHLVHLKDLDEDGKADSREVLLSGFGLEDRHELLNGFTWGPDGYLYMTHGVFTYSDVINPQNPDEKAVEMNAAVARFHPISRKFEVFSDGTSNPWGVDFDDAGNAFVSACVIDHLFHMVPGGIYERQAGRSGFQFAYEQLPSIVDHRHHMAAYCGIQVYLGGQYPQEYEGTIMMGNIHDNSVHADRLSKKGSSFVASKWRDLLRSDEDGWFRPVVQKVGPDGNLWIADWYDKYPCYQNALADPEGVDRERGRIWRIVFTGKESGKPIASRPSQNMNLSALSSDDLVALLSSKNIWNQKMAQILLTERGEDAFDDSSLNSKNSDPDNSKSESDEFHSDKFDNSEFENSDLEDSDSEFEFDEFESDDSHSEDSDSESHNSEFDESHSGEFDDLDNSLHRLFRESHSWQTRLRAFWTLHGMGLLRERDLLFASRDDASPLRTWAARLIGEGGNPSSKSLDILNYLAGDPEPNVRLGVAVALRQFVSGSLTINTPPRFPIDEVHVEKLLAKLIKHSGMKVDSSLHFLCWMAAEPLVAIDPIRVMRLFKIKGMRHNSLIINMLRKMMHRLSDLGEAKLLASVIKELGKWGEDSEALLVSALEGWIEAEQGKVGEIDEFASEIIADLSDHKSEEIANKARQLGTLWGDAAALNRILKIISDANSKEEDRVQAIEIAGQSRADVVRKKLLTLVNQNEPASIQIAAVRALTSVGDNWTGRALLRNWKDYSPSLKRAISTLCTTRWEWRWSFFEAIEKGLIARDEVSPSTVRALANLQNQDERTRAFAIFGRVNKTSEEKLKLIEQKRKVVLSGEPDILHGRELARSTCLICHEFYGEGSAVGPDLTGVGRSSLDALLSHVIDPNQIIGEGYENVIIETRDGQTLSGRLIEESPFRVRLLNQGGVEFVIGKDHISSRKSSEISLMPEGLEAMSDGDFRDLIWFILAPPQELPLTEARRRELIGR